MRRYSLLSSVGIKLFSVAPILAFRFIPAVHVRRFAVQISNVQQKRGQQPGGPSKCYTKGDNKY